MAQGLKSLVVAGHCVRGVCYASGHGQGNLCLSAIPPERVGPDGTYDYYGLAKRVQARFKDRLGRIDAAKVTVKQRGGVIILGGQVEHRSILDDLITLALEAEGTTHVEVWDLTLTALTAECHVA